MPQVSFEFFPPRAADGLAKLRRVATRLRAASPAFVSVTYGAGGSTRDGTLQTVETLRSEGLDVAPHLSFGADDDASIRALLERYRDLGVRRIVALRGDTPSGIGGTRHLRYAAELVGFIRDTFGDAFAVEVAAYPEVHPDAPDPDADLGYFVAKAEAGASGAITQYFYSADAYFDFVERLRARGCDLPVVPGIMPITNHAGLKRFSANCGADIPRWIDLRLQALEDDPDALKDFGADVVTRLCRALLDGGAPGLHFYTLNQSRPSLRVLDNLGLLGAGSGA